ncbi:MAG: hypothetical protein CMM32_06100, partial [Rhodospirillaceae bacterium]|nr:hypothetical protein [Rhodospirillaceae bacterium]
YKGPFRLSVQAIWLCARPVCRRLRALGVPFLGRGQPADDKGGARWAQKGTFDATSWGRGGLSGGAGSVAQHRADSAEWMWDR